MSDSAINVEGFSKCYLLGRRNPGGDGLRHVLQEAFNAPLRWLKGKRLASRENATDAEEFWAPQDISFEIKQGEVVAKIRALEHLTHMRLSLTFYTAGGLPLGSCFDLKEISMSQGQELELRIALPNLRLAPGCYHCAVAIGKGTPMTRSVAFDVVLDTLQLEVHPNDFDSGAIVVWENGLGMMMFAPLESERLT